MAAEADVLSLLDCIYDSNDHKGVSEEGRTYELFAACHRGQKTRAPGLNSFTTRLLDALEHLLDTPKDPPIVMTHLEEVINTRAPQGLIPVMLLDRLDNHFGRHIQLTPLLGSRTDKAPKITSENPYPPDRLKSRIVTQRWNGALNYAQLQNKKDRLESRIATQRWKDALNYAKLQSKKRKSVLS
ncbi:hypothetical protein B5807_07298 [Epicoccum nigrum]|jgi:hypothetical protein|uniref:Uncharacterized protein n=1 Tax=Epicoccum nigrum TaxID=105696 RepID=A0A1Y2LUC0_EPING|nr:hypothetical protein B5807_07298 [Epicoccum nigrum]